MSSNRIGQATILLPGRPRIIAGAAIDVFDKEPPLDLADPLLNCKNCLVTPHVAFATKQSMSLRAGIVFDNLDAWMKGNQKNVIL